MARGTRGCRGWPPEESSAHIRASKFARAEIAPIRNLAGLSDRCAARYAAGRTASCMVCWTLHSVLSLRPTSRTNFSTKNTARVGPRPAGRASEKSLLILEIVSPMPLLLTSVHSVCEKLKIRTEQSPPPPCGGGVQLFEQVHILGLDVRSLVMCDRLSILFCSFFSSPVRSPSVLCSSARYGEGGKVHSFLGIGGRQAGAGQLGPADERFSAPPAVFPPASAMQARGGAAGSYTI